jgi:aryl-alcohol dehydrogenase-like predicted oxidoreductase
MSAFGGKSGLSQIARIAGIDAADRATAYVLIGTSKVAHLEENVAAVNIQLSDEEFDALDREGWTEYRQS